MAQFLKRTLDFDRWFFVGVMNNCWHNYIFW